MPVSAEDSKQPSIRNLQNFLLLAEKAGGKRCKSATELARVDPSLFGKLLGALFGGRHMELDYDTMVKHVEFVRNQVFPLFVK